ncbi:MAG TPA: FAD-binding oxidoreductase [Steroidobacteraceae bacterium]|jgi:glycine/D-amino acid oxidase-like deaminating enzyme|nr:FAD-binding oxidoreductase [Steroidobacteraceae bacterium]
MGPYVDAIGSDEALPASTCVAVIGGGIIGVSAALHLASRGVPVTLCEKAYIACEQSSRNWGWCRQTGRDEREMPLIVASLALWRDMDRLTEADTGFRQRGVLYVGESEADEARFEEWQRMARPYGVDARLVVGAELEALMPEAARAYRCGLHVPTDGCAEPQRAAPAIARAAQRKGAIILNHCAVRGIERAGGRTAAVVTERGTIRCEAVILAGGAWSSLFCASLGIRLPQLKVLSSVMRTAPVARGPETCTYLDDVAYRKRQDGGYTIARGAGFIAPFVPDSLRYLGEFMPTVRKEWSSLRVRLNAQSVRELRAPRTWRLDRPSPFETARVLDPEPNRKLNRAAFESMIELYPGFEGTRVVQEWAGYIDATPDVIPYIGPVGALPGLIVAAGFSGHGFGIGPAAGQLAAELATAASPSVDPEPFRTSRFSDGSAIVIGPEI